MAGQAIGWQRMGKPDFSQCGKLFYRLPKEVREGMNRSEEKVLIWTLFWTWRCNYNSGRNTNLASFCETWLGMKFGRSRWTVARALARLEGWGLLKRIRRNPLKDGTFQTNLVAITAKLSNFLGTTNRQVPEKSPCSIDAPQEVENVYKRDKAASLAAPPLVSRQEEEECLDTRKKQLEDWRKMTQPTLSNKPSALVAYIAKAFARP